MSEPLPIIEPVADFALRLCFEPMPARSTDATVPTEPEILPSAARTATLRQALLSLRREPPEGLTDVIAGYRSLLLRFDPARFAPDVAAAWLRQRLHSVAATPPEPPRQIELPVWYGGEHGPDLEDLARHAGLSVAEVIALHAGARYTVAFLGFAPGFPYLLGLPPALHMPRLPSPRLQVPAGSVAIAGGQAGIYPQRSPGGWRLLGRTTTALVRFSPSPWTLLLPGDVLRFVPQTGSPPAEPAAAAMASVDPEPPVALHVLSPGPLTTVQDLGRPGHAHLGISAGGAADPIALRLANRLLGNPDGAAALELTLRGPQLRAECDLRLAVVGSLDLHIDGVAVPSGQTLHLRRGQILGCGSLREGVRGYLAVAGGLSLPLLAGSAATDLRAGFGGLLGRGLRSGDRLAVGAGDPAAGANDRVPHVLTAQGQALLRPRSTLRVMWGGQAAGFDPALRERLSQVPLRVRAQANRTGLRLQAEPPLSALGGAGPSAQLLSEGVSVGTVQVPPDGQPILLAVEQQVTGGYPQLAQVIAADWPLLGRLRPGDVVFLQPVSLSEAQAAYRHLWAQLSAAVAPRPDVPSQPVS